MVTPVAISMLIAGGFAALAVAEAVRPDRPARRNRWPVNLGLGIVNLLLVRILAIAAPAGAAIWASAHGIGLFRQIDLSEWLVVAVAVIILDLALYWQHRALHRFGWGWAIHRLHHADAALDVSTAVRFNPVEALVSMLYKSLVVIVLGLPVAAIFAFEAWIALGSLFEHSNLRLPAAFDRSLRRFWVTPAMHRVHHSAHGDDHNHNFGFAIAIWDRLFATYRAEESGPIIGLPQADAAG